MSNNNRQLREHQPQLNKLGKLGQQHLHSFLGLPKLKGASSRVAFSAIMA